MKIVLNLATLAILALPSSVLGLTFSVYNASDVTSINSWISGFGGSVNVIEDFEGQAPGWYETHGTNIGTFTAGGSAGSGATSYNRNNDPDSDKPFFSVQDQPGSWYGRFDTTDTGDSSQWLDSGDITELSLTGIDTLLPSLTNLFFYMQDASDAGAATTITSMGVAHNISTNQSNGKSLFVGISLAPAETLTDITWTTSKINDGYGLDDFSTVSTPVPEPATMFLFGTGLIGLAGIFRKRKK